MLTNDVNHMWTTGEVRVRASAPDLYAGLRGHAYIAVRGLNQPVERIVNQDSVDAIERLLSRPRVAKIEAARAAALAEMNQVIERLRRTA